MAKLSETDAIALLAGAVDLAARLAVLLPTLAQAVQDAKDSLSATDADALNAKIVSAHADIQTAAAQLEALRNA